MTATISEDCSLITVDSTDFASDNVSVELSLTIDGTTYDVEVDPDNTAAIEIEADTLSLDTLPQGIFYIELTVTTSDNTVITDSYCLASICSLHCDAMELYNDSANIEKILAYEGLKLSNNCVSCSCDIMQNLYDTFTETQNATNCNCQ